MVSRTDYRFRFSFLAVFLAVAAVALAVVAVLAVVVALVVFRNLNVYKKIECSIKYL
jgi:hypothetical protein